MANAILFVYYTYEMHLRLSICIALHIVEYRTKQKLKFK